MVREEVRLDPMAETAERIEAVGARRHLYRVETHRMGQAAGIQVSSCTEAILVPVLNEAGVIGPFLDELARYARTRQVYLLDSGSTDATVTEATDAARRHSFGLTVLPCPSGLALSILHGIKGSNEDRIVVIDGDGQHDPAVLDTLFSALTEGCDVAVASRHVAGASTAAGWPLGRRLVSAALLWVTRCVVSRHGVRDIASGCFALRRTAWERSRRFQTGGYKFLLDFLSASPRMRVAEVPVSFRARQAGRSKMALPILWEFMVSVVRAALRGKVPRRWISFGGVGTLGMLLDAGLMWFLHGVLGIGFAWARPVPILLSMTQNYILNNALTFADRRRRGAVILTRGWALSVVGNACGALVNWGVSVGVYSLGAPWLVALVGGVAAGMVVNYAIARLVVWPDPDLQRDGA